MNEEKPPIPQLPAEKSFEIFSWLDLSALRAARRVAKSWLALADSVAMSTRPQVSPTADFEWLYYKLLTMLRIYAKEPLAETKIRLQDTFSQAVKARMDELNAIQLKIKAEAIDLEVARDLHPRLQPVLDELVKLTKLLYNFNRKLPELNIIRPCLANFTLWHDSDEMINKQLPHIHLDYWFLFSGKINYETNFSFACAHVAKMHIIVPMRNIIDQSHPIRHKLNQTTTSYGISFSGTETFGDLVRYDDETLNLMNFKWQEECHLACEMNVAALQYELAMLTSSAEKPCDQKKQYLKIQNSKLAKTKSILEMRLRACYPGLLAGAHHKSLTVYTKAAEEIDGLMTDIAGLTEQLRLFQPQSASAILNRSDIDITNFNALLPQLTAVLNDYANQPDPATQNTLASLFSNAVKIRMNELEHIQGSVKSFCRQYEELEHAKNDYPRLLTVVKEIVTLVNLLYAFNIKLLVTQIIRPHLSNFTLWHNYIQNNNSEPNTHIYFNYWQLSEGLFNYDINFSLDDTELRNIAFAIFEFPIAAFNVIKEKLSKAKTAYNIHFLDDTQFGNYRVQEDAELNTMNETYQQRHRQHLEQHRRKLQNQLKVFSQPESETYRLQTENAKLNNAVEALRNRLRLQTLLLHSGIYELSPEILSYNNNQRKRIEELQTEIASRKKLVSDAKRKAEEDLPTSSESSAPVVKYVRVAKK